VSQARVLTRFKAAILRDCFTFSLLVVASLLTFFTDAAQMNVVRFEPSNSSPWKKQNHNPWKKRSRYSPPWLYRRTRILGLSRYRLIKYSVIIGVFGVLFAASILNGSIDATPPISISAASITVVDGDTVRANGQTYRLAGFDTPESGSLSRCERERKLANAATNRLRQSCSIEGRLLETILKAEQDAAPAPAARNRRAGRLVRRH
jgi:hypothetical protein